MAIQGAGKPGNQVNQGVALGAPYNPNNSMQGAPDFAGQAMQLIGEWMKMLAPPKTAEKSKPTTSATKDEIAKARAEGKAEAEDEAKKKGTTVKATAADSDKSKATDVETEAPAPLNARTAANLSLAADLLDAQVNAQYYGKPEESDFGKNFGANYAGAADTSLHFDKESEPST